jgi:hypothetical protein
LAGCLAAEQPHHEPDCDHRPAGRSSDQCPDRGQSSQKEWQKLHPNGEHFPIKNLISASRHCKFAYLKNFRPSAMQICSYVKPPVHGGVCQPQRRCAAGGAARPDQGDVAIANMLPTLTINPNLGYTSTQLAQLITPQTLFDARRQCNAYRVRWIFIVPYGAGGRGGTRPGGGPASQHRHHGVPERR